MASALSVAALVCLGGLVATPALAETPVTLEDYSSAYVRSLSAGAVVENGAVRLTVSFNLTEGYHVYWVNPGDSGTAPVFRLVSAQPGLALGETVWPVPDIVWIGPLLNYGYSDRVDYRVQLLLDGAPLPGVAALSRDIVFDADWLVCRIECVPEKARLRFRPGHSPVHKDSSSLSAVPTATILPARAGVATPARSEAGIESERIAVALDGQLPDLSLDSQSDFVWHLAGFDKGLFEPSEPQTLVRNSADDGWTILAAPGLLYQQLLDESRASARPLKALLLPGHADGSDGDVRHVHTAAKFTRLVDISAADVSASPPSAPPSASTASPPSAPPSASNVAQAGLAESASDGVVSWILALLFAFLGGALLNLMPCVLPVLSIKTASVVQLLQQGQSRRLYALAIGAYTAGILTMVLALAGALLALRGTGDSLAWGFQLQSPSFVLFISSLMLLVGLNLSGVFTISLPVSGRVSGLGHSAGTVTSHFFSGLLVVVLASPCTAPFMISAFTFAWQQPPLLALLVFVFLGLGLAAPWLALLAFPSLALRLPRPGPWSQSLQALLAFPIYATVLWLIWVLSRQIDAAELAWALAVLWLTGLVAWCYGRFGQGPPAVRSRRLALIGVVVGVLVFAFGLERLSRSDYTPTARAVSAQDGGQWSPTRVEELRHAGQAVFINFTAAWCATCLWNESRVFDRPDFQQALSESGTVYLVADWTARDQEIATVLAEYGRFSVPTYVYYPPGRNQSPVLLGQLPDLDEVVTLLRQSR
ncbi:MAG: thioredoxin family protein [Gammaproteobacteria bacterium]|nr:thioredoxin family protein [Gammaproteobacteria bacterium]